MTKTTEQLRAYAELVRKWTPRINLIAPATVDTLEERHIADSMQLVDLARPRPGQHWVDLGSGGGFPGLVVAIALQGQEIPVTLIESDQRKSVFLNTVIRDLGLENTTVLTVRIEAAPPQQAEIVSARALAPLIKLMPYVDRHLAPSGAAWLMKGARWQQEVSDARQSWRFDLETCPSSTDPDATILHVTEIAPL